jgi:hypothetical protein
MCIDEDACAKKYGKWFVVGVTLLILFVPISTHVSSFSFSER